MIEQFETILEAFKHPKVKLINKAIKKQGQLFDVENEIDIQFNGYSSLYDYQEHINKYFLKSKEIINQKMASDISQPLQLKQNLDLLKFEVKTFRRRYFQQNNDELMLSRIEILKNNIAIKSNDTFLKKNTSILFN
jgi:hypothetical protein